MCAHLFFSVIWMEVDHNVTPMRKNLNWIYRLHQTNFRWGLNWPRCTKWMSSDPLLSLLHALKGYLTCSILISSLCFIVYKYRSFYEVTKSSEILNYSFFAEENCSSTRMKSLRTVLLRLQTACSYTKQSFTRQRHRKLLAW